MKICAAQIKPVKGDIDANIVNHKKMITDAIAQKADMIVFPELSITGYEPELAATLATGLNDVRFTSFQAMSDAGNIIICAGMPLINEGGITISMLIFQPGIPMQVYSKEYLHADEYPYFVAGENKKALHILSGTVAFAICYEIFIAAHTENAYKNGAKIFIASVAKSVSGVEKAIAHLSNTAKNYNMYVIMANGVGHCDNFDCGGKSSSWNNEGELVEQLNEGEEGLLMYELD